ncbi:MAG: chemotaxis protein CheA [Acidobacteriota bacterium]
MESPDFLELFVSEAREHIEGQGALLLRARSATLESAEINDLFRHAHSTKGMAAAMGFTPMTALAHAMEDLLHHWRDGALAPNPGSIDLLMRANDCLSAQLDAVVAGTDLPSGDAIRETLRALSPASGDTGVAPGDPGGDAPRERPGGEAVTAVPADQRPHLAIDVVIRQGTPLPGARAMVILKRLEEHGRILELSPSPQTLPTGRFNGRLRIILATNVAAERMEALVAGIPDVDFCQASQSAPEAGPAPDNPAAEPAGEPGVPRSEAISTIRVATERLDHLLDGIGELILERERLLRAVAPGPGSEAGEILEGLGRTVDALRDEVMAMRLMPFSSIVPRLERIVRDVAGRLGKSVELQVRGTEVSLDRSTLEEMIDPLQHILRNSIDHGIEVEAARRAAGKPALGRIEIDLSRRDDRVSLVVADDGRGIDPQTLRRVAVERRLLSREAAMRLSDEEALMLVTLPGFSTATRTTEISGRGVGMDVVRMRVQKLGGNLIIRSQVGVGTRLEMDLPPTVTVTRAFLCRALDSVFAVPVSAVHGTLEIRGDSLQTSQGERVLRRGEDLVTVLPLGGILSGDTAAPFPATFPALMYHVGQRTYALGVDEILGEEQIVVKPLRHPLELLPQYAGAAVLNDGQIALILDPANLTRTSRPA